MHEMMRFFLRVSALALALAFTSGLSAASENEGATGLAFLKVGVDARASGMGEAYTAVAGDANATYWNTAGMKR